MRLLIIPEGTDFQTWTCTFDHVSLDTALPEGERPDLKAPPLPPAPAEARRLGGSEAGLLEALALGGWEAPRLAGSGPLWISWVLMGCSWLLLGSSLGALGRPLGALEGALELLGAPWMLLGISVVFLGGAWVLLGSSWGFLGRSLGGHGAV